MRKMDMTRQLSGEQTKVVQQAAATGHQHSNVLFHLKHEDATQWNRQHLKVVGSAGRHNII